MLEVRRILLSLIFFLAGPALAADASSLVLVFTGDNGGEVAPCG